MRRAPIGQAGSRTNSPSVDRVQFRTTSVELLRRLGSETATTSAPTELIHYICQEAEAIGRSFEAEITRQI